MAFYSFKISDFNHLAEEQQFSLVSDCLEKKYKNGSEDCILVGNYNIEGVELDAILFTCYGARILEFKNYGGNILARENGSWKADDLIIEGGSMGKSPFEQIRMNRSRVSKGLNRLLGLDPVNVSAAIIFLKDCNFDLSQISDTVKSWLHICDNSHIESMLSGLNTECMTKEQLLQVVNILKINEFCLDINRTSNSVFEPESSSDLFDELKKALTLIPEYNKVYTVFNKVFQNFLEQRIDSNRLNLAGTFAKTDYLLKEYHAKRLLVKRTNDTRVRLRNRLKMSIDELRKWYSYDLRNLCEFISFITKQDIPASLKNLFPTAPEESNIGKLVGDCLRVIVEGWSDDFVYAVSEASSDDEIIKIAYTHGNIYKFDWSYLKKMFYKGAQLNIIRPREEGGTIFPELIIFEPDYLVDISTVARCFTNYAESPFVALLNKLQSTKNSESIELGLFVGQLLDEEIHQLPNTRSYADSVNSFWKKNAIGLLTAGIQPSFHESAKIQKENIGKAIRSILPQNVDIFNSKEGIVEPSFFSEMLGLQGRMDYLQLDYKVLLEQKSGKGDYPYDNFVKPKHKEEHYVQLLLYMMLIRYNYRDKYEKNKVLHAFLLYSKYKESLLGLGFSPDLMFRALKIRNGIAWTEIMYSRKDGVRILEELTPDALNLKSVKNALWINYQRPQIEILLNPIKKASDLEKAYYFRFLTFISNEHLLSKVKEGSGLASLWQDSLEDKLLAGNIYHNLTLKSPCNTSVGNVSRIVLSYSDRESNELSNFREGDIVVLYPYKDGDEPDARKTMVFRSTIDKFNAENHTIELVLRATQSDPKVFLRNFDKKWAIEHDLMESSFGALYKGMHAFLSAPKERRDLLLFKREPQLKEDTQVLNGNYGEFDDLVLKVKRAKDLFLIIGPPGTGKTSFGLLNVLKEELTEPKNNVLLLSYTNRAVDEICSKLSAENIDFIRLGGEFSASEEYQNNLLSNKVQNCSNIDSLKQLVTDTRVFVSTVSSLNSNLNLMALKRFSLAIIDEASQILEPYLMSVLSFVNEGCCAVEKLVLIGDHKQLSAVVRQNQEVSKVEDPLLREILLDDCRNSLFERFLKKYRSNPDIVYLLRKQGRMHPDIALFPNYTFYGNKLEVVPRKHQDVNLPHSGKGINGIEDILLTRRVVFINAESPQYSVSDKVNQVESDIIASTILKIYEIEKDVFDTDRTLGVIVPFRNQIATIRNKIANLGVDILNNISIDTVERYQGSQRKYIIYGFTIQKYYQLKFLTNNVFEDWDGNIIDRKLNVAMTRAEEHLILVGNASLLNNNFTFFKMIEFVRSRYGYFDIPSDKYIAGDFKVPDYETIEIDLSKAVYTTSDNFNKAFNNIVLDPIIKASEGCWPNKVMGHDLLTNMNTIGYGRINFSNELTLFDEIIISPQKQVLLYCYYIMRQHYCSSMNIYSSNLNWFNEKIELTNGRLQFIDIGCGPATCGIAFSETFLKKAPSMVYTGIDVSEEMKNMGRKLLSHIFEEHLNYQTISSFKSLDQNFWEGCSELSSLVVFNISYFFSNVTTQFAEKLAQQILDVVKSYTLNKYVIVIQQSEFDYNLNSYKTFMRILSQYMIKQKEEKSSFSYRLNYKEKTIPFCYTILTN